MYLIFRFCKFCMCSIHAQASLLFLAGHCCVWKDSFSLEDASRMVLHSWSMRGWVLVPEEISQQSFPQQVSPMRNKANMEKLARLCANAVCTVVIVSLLGSCCCSTHFLVASWLKCALKRDLFVHLPVCGFCACHVLCGGHGGNAKGYLAQT